MLTNAAREPEVTDLAHCLVAMGRRSTGSDPIRSPFRVWTGLTAAAHAVVGDRIEAGTYAMAAAITGGELTLAGVPTDLLEAVFETLSQAGLVIEDTPDGAKCQPRSRRTAGVDVMTEPFPGFPTDLQAQIMAMMSVADGAAMITETIFENRFMHVPELSRMGANVNVHGASAMVRGVDRLTGAEVMATDLRASSSLVLAALAATRETVIRRVYHLDRGYERIEEKLAACGAVIERRPEEWEQKADVRQTAQTRCDRRRGYRRPVGPVAGCRGSGQRDDLSRHRGTGLPLSRTGFAGKTRANKVSGELYERVRCGISFDKVTAVRRRHLNQSHRGEMLDLLALEATKEYVDLLFAGGATIRLEVGSVLCHAEDFGDAWPTRWRPAHDEGA